MTTSTYTAEELLAAGYADRPDVQWLTNIAVELTGPGEVDEDDEREETPHIWEAVEHVVRDQASALAGRAAGRL